MAGAVPLSKPVIVVGMHRSGTRFATQALQELGVFPGADLDASMESRSFRSLNVWALQEVGTTWENPEPVDRLLEDPEVADLVARRFEAVLSGPRLARYLGLRRYAALRLGRPPRRPWGWKDPRTSLLLPVWLEVFPDARILHVKRHGVDVADSLHRRMTTLLQASQDDPGPPFGGGLREWVASLRSWSRHPFPSPLAGTLRARDHGEALDLWAAYLDRLEAHLEEATNPQLEVRLEDLLRRPRDQATRMAAFLDLDADDAALDRIAEAADPSRAYAFADDEALRALARQEATLLDRHGYRPDPPKADPFRDAPNE